MLTLSYSCVHQHTIITAGCSLGKHLDDQTVKGSLRPSEGQEQSIDLCHVGSSVEYSPAEKMEGIFVASRGGAAGSVGGDKIGTI
jgi:hypothetical protein